MSKKHLIPLIGAALLALPALSHAVDGNPGGVRSNESINSAQDKNQVKMRIAPHTVTIQTELQSAIDEVKGLRAQLEAIPDQKPNADMMDHLKMHSKQLNTNLKLASTHEQHLKSAAAEFPSVGQSEQYKSAQAAIQQADKANQSFQMKAKERSYWSNTNQALNDLNSLEKNLKSAMDKSKDLASHFDIKTIS